MKSNTQQTINDFLDFLVEHESPLEKINHDLDINNLIK